MEDLEVFVRTLSGECADQPPLGQWAVACVVRNRVHDDRWPDSYRNVCVQREQFSCWNDGKIPDMTEDRTVRAWLSHLALGMMSNVMPDVTFGANHYCNLLRCSPSWAREYEITLWMSEGVGLHTFFKG